MYGDIEQLWHKLRDYIVIYYFVCVFFAGKMSSALVGQVYDMLTAYYNSSDTPKADVKQTVKVLPNVRSSPLCVKVGVLFTDQVFAKC